EHTSELQSRRDLVCRLLLEKSSDVCSDRKSTRLNSSHLEISYAVFCLKKKCARRWTPPWKEARAGRQAEPLHPAGASGRPGAHAGGTAPLPAPAVYFFNGGAPPRAHPLSQQDPLQG